MQCRSNCGACCVAPSIYAAIPNMPNGKPAGVICANLDTNTWQCKIWGQDNYPKLCDNFKANIDSCGDNREEAIKLIGDWEYRTRPDY